MFWDGAVKIVTERPPPIRHVEEKNVVIAFLFNLLIPCVIKSRKFQSKLEFYIKTYFLAESSSNNSSLVN